MTVVRLVGGPLDGETRQVPDEDEHLVVVSAAMIVWDYESAGDPMNNLVPGRYEAKDQFDSIVGIWTWVPHHRRETG